MSTENFNIIDEVISTVSRSSSTSRPTATARGRTACPSKWPPESDKMVRIMMIIIVIIVTTIVVIIIIVIIIMIRVMVMVILLMIILVIIGKGQMGSALMAPLPISSFLIEGLFWHQSVKTCQKQSVSCVPFSPTCQNSLFS